MTRLVVTTISEEGPGEFSRRSFNATVEPGHDPSLHQARLLEELAIKLRRRELLAIVSIVFEDSPCSIPPPQG